MVPQSFALFGTPIGPCALAWNRNGIAGVQLPAGTLDETRLHAIRRWPTASEAVPPAGVQRAIDRILGLLGGARDDLADIPLDLADASEFQRQVWAVARAVPPGQTITYGEIGRRLGVGPERSREIGQTMGRNPVPIIVPCHRVLAASGRMGGFSAPGGVATKRRMLEIEGAPAVGAGPLFAP